MSYAERKLMKKRILVLTSSLVLAASLMTACGEGTVDSAETLEETMDMSTQDESESSDETESDEVISEYSSDETLAQLDEEGEIVEGEDSDLTENYFSSNPIMVYGTITSIDLESGDITLDKPDGQEIIFHTVKEIVPIIDVSNDLPADMESLEEGQPVYAWSSEVMTMSIPPQTSLQAMIVNVPENSGAPMYIVVSEAVYDQDTGTLEIIDHEGNVWTAGEDTEVSPFKTKNIVTLEDITEGSRIVVWDDCAKIVIL